MGLSKLNIYMELLKPKLTLSTVLAALGGAFYLGPPQTPLEWTLIALVLAGVTLANMSVHAIDDYMEYREGLGPMTPRTPLAGKVLVGDLISPGEALALFAITAVPALLIGVYFTLLRGLLILLLVFIGVLMIFTYSVLISRVGLSEPIVWLKGILVFAGSVYAVKGLMPPEAFIVGAIYGFTSAYSLYVAHTPPAEGYKAMGKKHLPVLLGPRAWAGATAIAVATIIFLVLSILMELLTPLASIALIPALALVLISTTLKTRNQEELNKTARKAFKTARITDLTLVMAIIASSIL